MSVTELLPALHELDRGEKLQVMQFLIQELANGEEITLDPAVSYPVWSPYDAQEAAAVLLGVLANQGQSVDPA